MKVHKRLSSEDAKLLGLKPKGKDSAGHNAKYYITPQQLEEINVLKSKSTDSDLIGSKGDEFTMSAIGSDGTVLNIDEYCEVHNLPREDIKSYKLVTHSGTPFYNIFFKEQDEILHVEEIDFNSIVSKYSKPITIKPKTVKGSGFVFDRLVYTDVHIGMDTNENGFSLYGGKWDEIEVMDRVETIISHVLSNQQSSTLIIDELGDFVDGWDGETVRKGHKLPQNMDNEKAFDIGIWFKTRLVDGLVKHYDKIVCNNICNDNHAGSFGYVVNSAFKSIITHRYKSVEVHNHRGFIVHYLYNNNCFILTHGKDGKHLKFGFKPILDFKQIEKIENYIQHHDLHKYNIEFSKGDSHQKIFDESTSDKFNYYNYGALSPSSEWVQTNFKKGKSFFEMFNYREDGNKRHNPYVFEWIVNRLDKTIDFSK